MDSGIESARFDQQSSSLQFVAYITPCGDCASYILSEIDCVTRVDLLEGQLGMVVWFLF